MSAGEPPSGAVLAAARRAGLSARAMGDAELQQLFDYLNEGRTGHTLADRFEEVVGGSLQTSLVSGGVMVVKFGSTRQPLIWRLKETAFLNMFCMVVTCPTFHAFTSRSKELAP